MKKIYGIQTVFINSTSPLLPRLVEVPVIRETPELYITEAHPALNYRIHHRKDDRNVHMTPVSAWMAHKTKVEQVMKSLKTSLLDELAVLRQVNEQIQVEASKMIQEDIRAGLNGLWYGAMTGRFIGHPGGLVEVVRS